MSHRTRLVRFILPLGLVAGVATSALADRLPRSPEEIKALCGPTSARPLEPRDMVARGGADGAAIRVVLVEWKIRKGREAEFLKYWDTRSTIPDRAGLIGEFLAGPESREQWPFLRWVTPTERPDVAVFYNIGLWRDAPSFQEQVGRFIDPDRAPLDFEAEPRARIVLAPQRWRAGRTPLPGKDSAETR